tara:strand:- start:26 stop:469 length:444 start_codon:yes stop_codon:yes gene_type:complete
MATGQGFDLEAAHSFVSAVASLLDKGIRQVAIFASDAVLPLAAGANLHFVADLRSIDARHRGADVVPAEFLAQELEGFIGERRQLGLRNGIVQRIWCRDDVEHIVRERGVELLGAWNDLRQRLAPRRAVIRTLQFRQLALLRRHQSS